MVTGVSARTWNVHGDQRSLDERWDAAAAKLIRLGGVVTGPKTEPVLADMQDEIKRLTPSPVWDAAVAEAGREFEATVRRYQTTHDDLIKQKRELERLRTSDEHRILGDINSAMFEVPPSAQEMIDALFGKQQTDFDPIPGKCYTPDFSTVVEYREATRSVLAQVHELENVRARMDAVVRYESLPREDQNRRLILALASRIDAVIERIMLSERIAMGNAAYRQKSTKRPKRAA